MRTRGMLAAAGLLLAVACSGTPDTPAATRAGDETARAAEREFWETYRAATAARTDGDDRAAVAAYERALQLRPAHGDSLHFLAQLLAARADVGAARGRLLALTRSEAHSLRGWRQLSLIDGMPAPGWTPDLSAAATAAATAAGLQPGDSGAWALRARWAAYEGDRELALDHVRGSLERNPRNLEARLLDVWLAGRAAGPVGAARALAAAVDAVCIAGATATEGATPAEASSRDGCPAGHELALVAALVKASGGEIGADTAARLPELTPGVTGGIDLRASHAEAPLSAWGETSAGVYAALDLDGDGTPDLRVSGEPEGAVRLSAIDGTPLPGAATGAWDRPAGPGAVPVPWRGVRLRGDGEARILLAGGGARPLRLYARTGDVWTETPARGLPAQAHGAVIAAADFDLDGRTDVFVGNVPIPDGLPGADPSGVASVLHRALADGSFSQSVALPTGLLASALPVDLDDDGDADLLAARRLEPQQAADGLVAASEDAPATAAVTLWRNDGGKFVLVTGVLPAVPATVTDMAAVRVAGRVAVYLATGEMTPELVRPDRLLVATARGVVEASGLLREGRWGNTVRVASGPGQGQVTLLRGGLVPGDPPRAAILTLDR